MPAPEDKAAIAEASLRSATRQAHEAIKDLRSLIQESHKVVDEINEAAQVAVNERVEPAVKEEIRKLGEATKVAMDAAVDKVAVEFQRLENLFLGKEKRDLKRGKPSLEELIERRG